MFYHVTVTQKSTKGWAVAVGLDYTEERLNERIIRPYEEGRPLVVRGRSIPADDVLRVTVHRSEDNSGQLLARVRAAGSAKGSFYPETYFAATSGEDVTEDFISGAPGCRAQGAGAPVGSADPKKVFVVHGRDEQLRLSMFRLLRALRLEPIGFEEAVAATRQGSPYIGDVLDKAFEMARAVVVLMTPDDEVRLSPRLAKPGEPAHETELTAQPRPNVLFEAGMALGKKEDRTIIVEIGTLRPISDVSGRQVVRLDGSTEKRQQLADRLKTAGCDVKFIDTDWQTEGDFSPPGATGKAASRTAVLMSSSRLWLSRKVRPCEADRRKRGARAA